jgi:hypothetical protein
VLKVSLILTAFLCLALGATANAASGPSGRANAAQAQYGTPPAPITPDTDQGEVLPTGPQSGGPTEGSGTEDITNQGGGNDTTPSSRETGAGTPSTSTSGGSLPFTGGATVPLLIAGALALFTGLALRTRTGRQTA